MTAIIKNNFKLQNARDFLENFGSTVTDRNHYLFVGKPTVWGQGTQAEELTPPAPQDTDYDESRVWDEMLSLKKIDEARVSLVVPRSDWKSNTVYAVYDDKDENLYKQPTPARITTLSAQGKNAGNFYVVTDEFDIFICLNNGNNAVSTAKPIRLNPVTNLVNYSEVDGYIWKYVGTVTQSEIVKFVTDSWIPVRTLVPNTEGTAPTDLTKPNQWSVQQAAVSGQVVSVQVDSQGSGFTGVYSGGFQSASISNTGPSGKGIARLTSGALPINVPSEVESFYVGAQVHIITGQDSGSIYTIESYSSATKQITLSTPWNSPLPDVASTCQILPRISITTNGNINSPIKLRPVVEGGAIKRVIILNAGSGANFVGLTIPTASVFPGSGAVIRAVLSGVEKGLGADIEKDLGAYFVMLNARLDYTEGNGDFPLQNDYRQLGIIRNVRNYNTTTLSTATTLIATKKLILSGVSGSSLTFDEIVQSGGVSARVIDYTPDAGGVTGTLTYIQNTQTGYGNFTAGQTLQGTQSITPFTATISSVINEEVRKGFGEMLYLENRRAVLRAPDQIEDIKAIIEF
jgi:hypothetical protein